MLEMRDISKVYSPGSVNEHVLFRHFNLTVEDGQFISVVGSNGSGKTSMLNLICGSIPLDEGKIIVNGKDITRVREHKRYRTIGRVYQNPVSIAPSPSHSRFRPMRRTQPRAWLVRDTPP